MDRHINLLMTLAVLSCLIIPSAQAITAGPVYNCTGDHLVTNITAQIDGEVVEIWYDNSTCAFGCSLSGLSCNEPRNVDSASVSVAAVAFIAFSIIFFYLSQNINLFNKKYYVMKYFYLGVAFVFLIISIGLLGNMNTFGQDNISRIIMSGYYVLIFTGIITFLIIFFTEMESWYKSMREALGDR